MIDISKAYISYLNPLRYIDVGAVNYDYKTGAFDDVLYSTRFNTHYYKQKFAINDVLKGQFSFYISDANLVLWQPVYTARIMDFNGIEYASLTLNEITGDWNDSGFYVFEFEKTLTSTYQGNYYIELAFEVVSRKILSPFTYKSTFISEPFEVSSWNNELLKIKYRRDANDLEAWCFFDTKIEFELRAELLFNQAYVFEPKTFNDQKQNASLTDVIRARERELKNTKPLPYWMSEKIALALACEEVKLFEPKRTLNAGENYYYTLVEITAEPETIFDFEPSQNCTFKVRENDMKFSTNQKCWEEITDEL